MTIKMMSAVPNNQVKRSTTGEEPVHKEAEEVCIASFHSEY